MQEFDLGYVSTETPTAASVAPLHRSAASYRLAAWSLGFDNGARAYAGNFAAASGHVGGAVGNFFFAHPAMVGIAFKSKGSRLSDYGLPSSIRLVLPMDSHVRISAAGRELFNGMLGAGDQQVEFMAYQDAFVDVSIRDAAGGIRTQLAAVTRKLGNAAPATEDIGFWGDIYLDAGHVLDTARTGPGFRVSDTRQIGAHYIHPIWKYLLVAGFQSIGERRRYAISVAPIDKSWQVNFMRGNNMESGYHFSGPLLEWDKLHLLLNQTSYRVPLTTLYSAGKPQFFLDDKNCISAGSPLCHQTTSFDVLGLTLQYEGFPFHLGYIETHTMVERFSTATLSGVFHFSLSGLPLSATAFVARDLERKNNSAFVSLSMPIGAGTDVSAGVARSSREERAALASYRYQAAEDADQNIRSAWLIGANAWSPDARTSSAAAFLNSRLGPVESIASVAATDSGSRSFDSTLLWPARAAVPTAPPCAAR